MEMPLEDQLQQELDALLTEAGETTGYFYLERHLLAAHRAIREARERIRTRAIPAPALNEGELVWHSGHIYRVVRVGYNEWKGTIFREAHVVCSCSHLHTSLGLWKVTFMDGNWVVKATTEDLSAHESPAVT